jgi:hypothetical protein
MLLSYLAFAITIGGQLVVLAHHTLEWIGPVILFSAVAISHNPEIMPITLGVVSNYLADWFRDVPKKERTARLKMVQKTKEENYKIFDYDGRAENLGPIKDAIGTFYDERQN